MLETSRRGFFGLLAGALLAKVIGPRLIAGVDRAPAMREAAASHIVEHTYLPLEVFSSRVLEIVNQELKWLRLKQVHSDFEHLHLGDTVAVREPCRFEPRVKRGVISKDPGVGLSLRALEDGHPSRGEPRTPERVMRFDIMFGLG